MGRNMLRMLQFAMDYDGWHSYAQDRATVGAIRRLAALELIEVNQFKQFRARVPKQQNEKTRSQPLAESIAEHEKLNDIRWRMRNNREVKRSELNLLLESGSYSR